MTIVFNLLFLIIVLILTNIANNNRLKAFHIKRQFGISNVLKKFQLCSILDMYRQGLGPVIEEAVCREHIKIQPLG